MTMPGSPPPLDYQRIAPPLPRVVWHPYLKICTGTMLGAVVVWLSAICWASGPLDFPTTILTAIGIEFSIGVVITVVSRQNRPFGIGLILAVPIGLLLFFVGCAIMMGK